MKPKVEKLKPSWSWKAVRGEERRRAARRQAPWKSATIWLPQHPGIVARIFPEAIELVIEKRTNERRQPMKGRIKAVDIQAGVHKAQDLVSRNPRWDYKLVRTWRGLKSSQSANFEPATKCCLYLFLFPTLIEVPFAVGVHTQPLWRNYAIFIMLAPLWLRSFAEDIAPDRTLFCDAATRRRCCCGLRAAAAAAEQFS